MSMVGEQQDARHPKVKAVVERVLDAWHADEKTLLFCFRSNTARRLRDILGERIAAELSHARPSRLAHPPRWRPRRAWARFDERGGHVTYRP